MPEQPAEERTEEATPRRQEKERERGRVAKSRDLAAASILIGSVLLLRYGGKNIFLTMATGARRIFEYELALSVAPDDKEIMEYLLVFGQYLVYAAVPFMLALFVLAYVVHVIQIGFLFASESLTLDLNKLNPINGVQRMFSLRSLMTLVMNLGKLAVVIGVAYATMAGEIPKAAALTALDIAPLLTQAGTQIYTLALRLAITLFILGLADMLYQVYQHGEDLRMTKQEVKEEMKEMDGDPKIKAKRRQIQRQLAMQRMMQEVPEAEVVVRNPTHYAVALQYKPDMDSPVVVAKGVDHVARRIIDLAIEAGVPTWIDRPLARSLYQVEIGDPIPNQFFQAVAQILAHVLKGEKLADFRNSMGVGT